VLQVLHNPRYAGAFFYGRHTHRIGPGGKPTIHVLPREQWTVLITDTHPGYLTFPEFEANQARLAEQAAARGTDRRASPPREGPALLQGLTVCGICGTRMTVRYHTRAGRQVPSISARPKGSATARLSASASPARASTPPSATPGRHPHPAGHPGRVHRRRGARGPRRPGRPDPRRCCGTRPLPG